MSDKTPKILMLVEGAKTDLRLMKHLLKIYGISDNHEIVSYNTNIYTLYREMFSEGEPDSVDLLQLLKSREKDLNKKKLFDEIYSDVLLIFDIDPQASDFSPEKISEMQSYFVESSDMGKLYLNYPMVEAFYHMKSIPDKTYLTKIANLNDLKSYKTTVNRENRNHDYTKFAVNKEECDIVIRQNIEKGIFITNEQFDRKLPDLNKILQEQLKMIYTNKKMFVLCTCGYYIVDFNPKFVLDK